MKSHARAWLFFCLENGWRSDYTKMSELIKESNFNRESDFAMLSNFYKIRKMLIVARP